jgi:rubrerythrin
MMPAPSDDNVEERLAEIVSDSAAMSAHCLAAAERAVIEGRFNIAKVLRVCAHSTRVSALAAARLLAQGTRPAEVLTSTLALLEQQSLERQRLKAFLTPPTPIGATPQSAALENLLRRAIWSLERNRDVLESDVAQSLWGCQVCGSIAEGSAPRTCSLCGALRFEFEWFGPFYSGSFERLGRRSPEEVARILTDSPQWLTNLLQGIDEERLASRPSPDEWSMKEIAGHLIDVTHLFCQRVRTIGDATNPPSLDGSTPPWRMLEGKGYPDLASRLIVEGFRSATQEALDIIQGFDVDDWSRFGLVRGRVVTTNLDLGTWLANHNIAHCAQLEALREVIR